MIERVARVLCERGGNSADALEPGDAMGIDGYLPNGDPAHFMWREWSNSARAAIEAMREPTEAMIDVGQHVNSEWLNDNAPIGERRYREPAKAVFLKMIDAALEEAK